MENAVDASSWRRIVADIPEWAAEYHLSTNNILDEVIDQYVNLLDGRQQLADTEALEILMHLSESNGLTELINEQATLHVQGRGMYYASKTDTVEFLDSTAGVSGYFTGLQIDDLPLYHDLVYKNQTLYRPLLCVALEGYALHSANNTPGVFVDDTVIVPILGQDLCINRYVEKDT